MHLRCLTHSILILSGCLLFSPTNRLLPTSLQQSATKSAFKLHLHRYACYDCNVGYHGENLAQGYLSCSNRIWLCGSYDCRQRFRHSRHGCIYDYLPCMVFKQPCQAEKIFLSATVMLLFAKLLRLFSLCFDDKSKGFDKFQEIFVFSGIGWILLAACAVITGILYLIDYQNQTSQFQKPCRLLLPLYSDFVLLP